jgi:hypothetical protein
VTIQVREGGGSAELARAISELTGQYEAKIGWLKGEMHVDPNTGRADVSTADIAAAQEFGTPGIPPRLGMRATIAAQQNAWTDFATQQLLRVATDESWSIRKALGQLAATAQRDFLKTIKSVNSPPLSKKTVAMRAARQKSLKGKVPSSGPLTKPLIDTSQLVKSLRYAVTKK